MDSFITLLTSLLKTAADVSTSDFHLSEGKRSVSITAKAKE